jgi:sugar phosphate isomerase/epimerase
MVKWPVYIDTYSYHFASDAWKPQVGAARDIYWIIERSRSIGADGIHLAGMVHFHDHISVDSALEKLKGGRIIFGTCGCESRHMRDMVDLCSKLGERVFRTFLGVNVSHETIQKLKEIMSYCEKKDVRIAVENHQDLTSGQILEVLEQVDHPHLGVCLDTGNALGVLEDPLAAAERLAPHTFMTHIKEYAVMQKGSGYVFWTVPTGQGSCSVREQLEILFEKGPWKKEVVLNVEAPLEYFDKSEENGKSVVDALQKHNRLVAGPPWMREKISDEALLNMELTLAETSMRNFRLMLEVFS